MNLPMEPHVMPCLACEGRGYVSNYGERLRNHGLHSPCDGCKGAGVHVFWPTPAPMPLPGALPPGLYPAATGMVVAATREGAPLTADEASARPDQVWARYSKP